MNAPPTRHDQLIAAEIAYAHFNALRTADAAAEARIRRVSTDSFECLCDPSRPSNAYYNRAVAKVGDFWTELALKELPSSVIALEVTSAQLTPPIAVQLGRRGFKPSYELCYLGVTPAGDHPITRSVVRLERSQVDCFFDMLQLGGVPFPPEKRELKNRYYCTEQFQTFVVNSEVGTACAWATMFVNGMTAFLGNSFTLPQFRNSGAHTALLAARLNAAAAQGLSKVYTDVVPGSQSQHNCERAGFRSLSVNAIWSRAADAVANPAPTSE